MKIIHNAICSEGFSEQTIEIIDNYIKDIINGKTNLTQFNQKEHAGLCCAGEVLIGAYIVCDYAQTSLTASEDVRAGEANAASKLLNH